jgi:anti-sigma factor RsiW
MRENDTPTCEHAPGVSALLDGELAAQQAPELVAHLLDCRSCATFFRRSRSLDAALILSAAAEDAGAEPPRASAELWDRIRSSASAREASVAASASPKRRRLPRWTLAAAAALLLALGIVGGWQLATSRFAARRPSTAARSNVTFASLETRTPTMDERRFVAIARELLAADSRYRDAMAGVLAVARSEEPTEGSTEESSWREEELRGLRPEPSIVH